MRYSNENGTLSPRAVEKLIDELLTDPRLAETYRDCEVTMEQDLQAIDTLLE